MLINKLINFRTVRARVVVNELVAVCNEYTPERHI